MKILPRNQSFFWVIWLAILACSPRLSQSADPEPSAKPIALGVTNDLPARWVEPVRAISPSRTTGSGTSLGDGIGRNKRFHPVLGWASGELGSAFKKGNCSITFGVSTCPVNQQNGLATLKATVSLSGFRYPISPVNIHG